MVFFLFLGMVNDHSELFSLIFLVINLVKNFIVSLPPDLIIFSKTVSILSCSFFSFSSKRSFCSMLFAISFCLRVDVLFGLGFVVSFVRFLVIVFGIDVFLVWVSKVLSSNFSLLESSRYFLFLRRY